MFDELRVAAQVNEEQFEHAIPTVDWIKMITVNPATALALENYLGRLAQGLKADITVLRARDADPNTSLLQTHLQDVEMVWVGGRVLYGNRAAVDAIRPGDCEALLVHGSHKRICVRDPTPGLEKGRQTLDEIRTRLHDRYSVLAPLAP